MIYKSKTFSDSLTATQGVKWTPQSILLFLVFFFSGFSSLIYQVVWQRLLTLHYGVGPVSVTLIVSVYMVGLGVGALFGGYLAEKVKAKIMLYAVVELLIGIFGLISLPLLHWIGSSTAGSSYIISLFFMFLFLFIPTFLMGITLPLLIKIINSLFHNFIRSVSLLYFINTLGAAIGTLVASYFFISFFGLDTAAYIAAFVNLILAILIFTVRNNVNRSVVVITEPALGHSTHFLKKWAYLLVFITGFLAIGYEIVWFRVIGVLVKASPYAFSSVLAVYLFGIAIGSYGMNVFSQKYKLRNRKRLFFLLQVSIAMSVLLIFLGYYFLTRFTSFAILTDVSFSTTLHPLFSIPSFNSFVSLLKSLFQLFDVFWWSAFFMLIPTILMGASFPLITSLALLANGKDGKTAGTVYFYNIIGNVLGGLITGFVLLPFLGSEKTLVVFILFGALFTFFILNIRRNLIQGLLKGLLFFVAVFVLLAVFPKNGDLYKLMHKPFSVFKGEYNEYFEEGLSGVNITYQKQEHLMTYINGLGHGLRPGYRFYFEAMEAISFTDEPKNSLVIGFGTGSITEIVQRTPSVDRITLVELNATLLKNLRKVDLFSDILGDRRLNLIIDDGRRYLLRNKQKFDFVAMDPLRTTTAYSNNIYSSEFFQLIREHINPKGVLLVWTDEIQVLPKTIASVFPYVRVYDYFVLASLQPFKRHDGMVTQILHTFPIETQRGILSQEATNFIGDQEFIRENLSRFPINKDWKPVTEYYFGLSVKKRLLYNR